MQTAIDHPSLVDPRSIQRNPENPRRYFNDTSLDLLRTSIQEVGVLVPLIVYQDPENPDRYVLMDGERRWSSSLALGLSVVPVSFIDVPTRQDNLLRMFNIHAVREDWPLISVALSLRELMKITGEDREVRLSELTGLTRSTVRRAKRLLSLPPAELDLIQAEAHLDRNQQVHREDLYLEIEAAVSVLETREPNFVELYGRDVIIRAFARKREVGSLQAVTEFRLVGRLLDMSASGVVGHDAMIDALTRLVEVDSVAPRHVFQESSEGYAQQSVARRSELLVAAIRSLDGKDLAPPVRQSLESLRLAIDELLRD